MTSVIDAPTFAAERERPAAPRRRVRMPLLAASMAMALLAALLVVWGFSRAADRAEVLMVSAPVEQGRPIPASALTTAMVGVDGDAGGFLPVGTDLSGMVAAVDLAPGTVLSAVLVVTAAPSPAGWFEVGAVVRAGRYPSTVEIGDELRAVPLEGATEIGVELVEAATPGEDGSLRMVLAVPAESAGVVAQWAASESLTLVRVP